MRGIFGSLSGGLVVVDVNVDVVVVVRKLQAIHDHVYVYDYARHDGLIKPLPGHMKPPALAESWAESADGLTYEFKLREGLTFHNGDPFTAEDVKFSFEGEGPPETRSVAP